MSGKAIDFRRWVQAAFLLAATLALALVALATPGTASAAKKPKLDPNGIERFSHDPAGEQPYHACPPATREEATCLAVTVPPGARPAIRKQRKALGIVGKGAAPALEGSGEGGGFSPADLRAAYNIPEAGGKGTTIAITGAFGYPKAESDLNAFRAHYGLSECTTANGCFRKVNQKGEEANYPPPPGYFDGLWDLEAALDLDMASAMCPECKILYVEADDNFGNNLGAAVNKAAELGAAVISNSWGGGEGPEETEEDSLYFNHPGIPMFFSSGDSGYGVIYPAASSKVVAVGGTSLLKDKSIRGWRESAWRGAGSGCSAYEAKPEWQTDTGCAKRTIADVSAVADPATPVAVYNSNYIEGGGLEPGWVLVGGTSASAPIVAAITARASESERAKGAKLFWEQGPEGKLFDVAEGYNGVCYPEAAYLCAGRGGYDGPTGWGTPGAVSPRAPTVGTYAASEIGPGKATLNGVVNPNGKTTFPSFEYGTTTAYGTTVATQSLSGTSPVEVSLSPANFTWGTTYHYRLVASNGSGKTYGADHTFVASRWAVQETPAQAYKEHLWDVSCGSTNSCMSVGLRWVLYEQDNYQKELEEYENGETTIIGSQYVFGREAYAERWNGSEWVATAAIVPHEVDDNIHSEFNDVSCTSSSFCMASGANVAERKEGEEGSVPLVEQWNGSAWSVSSVALPSDAYVYEKGFKKIFLDAISCTGSTFCMAVGSYHAKGPKGELIGKSLAETWDGTKWQILATSSVKAFTGTHQLSCVSPSWCMLTGTKNAFAEESSESHVATWDGVKWIEGVRFGHGVSGLSCTSSIFCAAVGSAYHAEEEPRGSGQIWNGKEWSSQEIKGAVKDVSCIAENWCATVGYTGGYEVWLPAQVYPYEASSYRWNGTEWSAEPPPQFPDQTISPRESELWAVSCKVSGCTALGEFGSPAGEDPLTERLTLPPENRTVPVVSQNTKYGGSNAYQGVSEIATEGTWSGQPGIVSFQWQRCNASGAECSNISGATEEKYTPAAADVGKTLVMKATANGPGGINPVVALSKPTPVVAAIGQASAYTTPIGSRPGAITVGPDKNLWFTMAGSNKVGKMTTTGTATEYALPAGSAPSDIASGPESRLWFTNYGTDKIGKISTTGAITEYTLPAGSKPCGITEGPTGVVWYTDSGTDKVVQMIPSGTKIEYSLTSGSHPCEIVYGPDGNLWFTESNRQRIAKVSTTGTVTEYAVPSGGSPSAITVGPDGNIWFTLFGNNKVGKLTTSGVFTEYSLAATSFPEGIATGPDGNLWVTEWGANRKIARVTTGGTITEYALPSEMKHMRGIAYGPDNRMWLTSELTEGSGIDEIGAIIP
jgi:streptogramin lyase